MLTQQGFHSTDDDELFDLQPIYDVNNSPNNFVLGFHDVFSDLPADLLGGVQETQMATTLTNSHSALDSLQNPMRTISSTQVDWPVGNFSAVSASSLEHQHTTGQLHTSNCNDSTFKSVSASTEGLFVFRDDLFSLGFQLQVLGNPGDVVQSGYHNDDLLPDPQAPSTPDWQSLGFNRNNQLTSLGTPAGTSGGTQSARGSENFHLGVTPEDTSWDMLSPNGSLGESWSAIGSSEGNTPVSHIGSLDPPPDMFSDDFSFDAGSMTAESGSVHGTSKRSSPFSYEQRPVPELGFAFTIPDLILPTNTNPDTSITVTHAESAPSISLRVPTSQDWDSKVLATKRKSVKNTEDSRAQAKRIRKMGACVRCHMYKFKCDEGTPCKSCCDAEISHRLFFQPCSRQDIQDASLVRHGNGKFGQQKVSFRKYLWTNIESGSRTIEIRWTLSSAISVPIQDFKVRCNEFVPSGRDITAEKWQVGGKITTVNLPCFACADEDELTRIIDAMVGNSRAAVEERITQSIADALTRTTFDEAYRYARKYNSKMVKLALRISSTAAFCQGWGSIVGAETLDTPEVENAADGYCGTRPISPALCHQVDVIFLKMMENDEQALVKELKKAIFQKNPKPWYEIFLAYFVIMWHLKFIHGEAVGFKRCQEQTDEEGKVSFLVTSMVDEWENSAGNMLYHFRYVLRGFLPFQKARENMDAVRNQGNLDDHAVYYLARAVSLLDERDWLTEDSKGQPKRASGDPDDKWIRRLFEG